MDAGTVAAYLTLDTSDFMEGIASAGQALTTFRNEQSDGISGIGSMLGVLGRSLLGQITGLIGSVGSLPAWNALPARLAEKGVLATDGLIRGLLGRGTLLQSTATRLVTEARNAAGTVSFTSVGSGIVTGILSGMNGRKTTLMTAARSLAAGVSSVIRGALQIHSPSRVMMEIGEMTAKGLEIGLGRGAENVYRAASAVSRETAETLAGVSSAQGYAFGASGTWNGGDRLDRLLDAVERLADAQTTVEIDGRPFGRLVKEYV